MHDSLLKLVTDEQVDFVRFGQDENGLVAEIHFKDGSAMIARQHDNEWVVSENFSD